MKLLTSGEIQKVAGGRECVCFCRDRAGYEVVFDAIKNIFIPVATAAASIFATIHGGAQTKGFFSGDVRQIGTVDSIDACNTMCHANGATLDRCDRVER